jgi:ParB family protein of integrating conjugative element (PFGI_1 class)
MKHSVASMKDQLLKPSFEQRAPAAQRMSDPIVDTSMVLTLDEALPWDTNPRTTRNPKYDELKESIRHRGLDTPPPVTRRPGEDKFRIRNGGNTRLAILNELYRETGDDKYFRFHTLFRPWDALRGEIISLTGHLAENDLQGQLLFIERAIGVDKARQLYEADAGEKVSLRELSRLLKSDGYPVSASHLSRMQDTIRYLLPAVPGLLYSGLGIDRISKVLALRKTSRQCWEQHSEGLEQPLDFDQLFQDVLAQFEGEADEFLLQRFQDELIHQIKGPLGLGYEAVLLEITQNQDQLRRSTSVADMPPSALVLPPTAEPAPGIADVESGPAGTVPLAAQSQPDAQPTSRTDEASSSEGPQSTTLSHAETQARLEGHIASPVTTSSRVQQVKQQLAAIDGEQLPDFAANALVSIPVQAGGLHPISDLWYIEREIDTPAELRLHIAQLAREVAESVNAPGEIYGIEGGIGFSYRHPVDEAEVNATAQHTLTLLQSLSGSIAIALNMIQQQPEMPKDALSDFEFAAGLGHLLLGQPAAKDGVPDGAGRLSDGALVKLFRIIRLARRLIDLEIKALGETVGSASS